MSSYVGEREIRMVAHWILGMNAMQLQRLRTLLMEGGDPAGVGAMLPPDRPLKEGGAEANFEDWPEEYWEAQA